MRHFKERYFDGAGEESEREHKLLHTILDDALSHVSGTQQPSHGYDDSKQREQSMIHIREAAQDIYMALTGKEVKEIDDECNNT